MSSNKVKSKLRTASDIIGRIKWSHDSKYTCQNTIVGYDCRIHGPMEKCLGDFKGINEGGDIPEHRIQYFRLEGTKNWKDLVFWDRLGRVDRLYGSGSQTDDISPITVDNISKALVTMRRIAEEKEIRAKEKAKRRARQQARRAFEMKKASMAPSLVSAASSSTTQTANVSGRKIVNDSNRHTWEELPTKYVFDESAAKWVARPARERKTKSASASQTIKVVTWNILFDLHHNEMHELVEGDDTLLGAEDSTQSRWDLLLMTLRQEDADLIALQEVTPRFLVQLEQCQWVKQKYALSAFSSQLQGVDTYGNMFLWKETTFVSSNGLHLCRDGNRNRALALSLLSTNGEMLNVANVHLPADQYDSTTGGVRDRTTARQREFSAIISKLQVLEQIQSKDRYKSVPVVLGDFNSGDNEGLSWPRTLVDAWLQPNVQSGNTNGFTFNWKTNQRANETRMHGHQQRDPRRIDRILFGNPSCLMPCDAKLIGDDVHEFPPSDHFGVSMKFDCQLSTFNAAPILYSTTLTDRNVWASSAEPTSDALLAMIVEDEHQQSCDPDLFDNSSSLPLPHITFLNGFVDVSSAESLGLAIQAVQDSVKNAIDRSDGSKQFTFTVNAECFSIFEHRDSATMVCLPQRKKYSWLDALYDVLRSKFPQCDQQESRFVEGWTPHLSMGKYSTVASARTELNRLIASGLTEERPIRGIGLGIFRRDKNDGKFRNVAMIPLVDRQEVNLKQSRNFLKDVGSAWAASMSALTKATIYELDSICQQITKELWKCEVEANVSLFGSQALGVALPGISDVDAVIQLRADNALCDDLISSLSPLSFLELLSTRLSAIHLQSKHRLRISCSGTGPALFILTIKLSSNFPTIDVLLAKLNHDGTPVDLSSRSAMDAVDDARLMLVTHARQGIRLEVFQGAARIIKLWAKRRCVYGASTGYLGGGGWVTLLVWQLENMDSSFHDDGLDRHQGARKLAAIFFRNIFSLWSNCRIISLGERSQQPSREDRNNMVVITPSGGDFGRASTSSTMLQTLDELRRASVILGNKRLNDEDDLVRLDKCLEPYRIESSEVVVLQVSMASSSLKPGEIKARACALQLRMTVALEKVIAANHVRPHSNVLRRKGFFFLSIGIGDRDGDSHKKTLSAFIESFTNTVQQESVFGGAACKIMLLPRDEYIEKYS